MSVSCCLDFRALDAEFTEEYKNGNEERGVKDIILKSYVDSFSESEGYVSLKNDDQFERFVNFCIVSKQYPRDFDVEALSVGGDGDTGIDGVAITVNGNIVQSEEEAEYLCSKGHVLDVSFTFIQSKNSARFKGDQVGTLIFGLKNFFDKTSSIPENEHIKELRAAKDRIYQHSINFDEPPVLRVYFVTTGEWKEPEHILGRAKRELRDLEDKRLFRSLEFSFYDAEKLKDTYREIRRKTVKEIDFPNHVALPEIPNVRQSFIGSLSAKEYIDLITDSEGRLQKSLFEDNVRDFQGDNRVNEDIGSTIKDVKLQAALSILNNGITIIAKRVDPVGTKLKLTDFQVVNGCQSSHVLFENRSRIEDGTHVVLKVIETTDQELSARVIKATNKQTIVTDEAFESLSPFHKELEEFYKAHSSIVNPIYYERRSKQYDGIVSVPSSQVMTLTSQIKAYVATTLGQPHSTHRYYGELLDANRSRMFREGESKEKYFIACLAFNRLEKLLRSGEIHGTLKIFRYQMLYLSHCYFDYLAAKKRGFGFDQVLSEYCDPLRFKPVLLAVAKVVDDQILALKPAAKREAERSRDFTLSLKAVFESSLPSG